VIWDSLAIGEYLAERFPEAGLWPADPDRRAIARSVVAEMHSGFPALRSAMPMNIRASYPGDDPGPEVDLDIRRIVAIWEACRRDFGAGGDFLFGGFSLADAFYAPVVSRFRTYGVDLDGAAGAYMTAVWAWPAVQSWVAAAEAEPWVVERYER
jgi:glutathione S-transferase